MQNYVWNSKSQKFYETYAKEIWKITEKKSWKKSNTTSESYRIMEWNIMEYSVTVSARHLHSIIDFLFYI